MTIDETPLIPREVLFGNPDKASPALSPDGASLAFLAPVDGVLNVWVGPADTPTEASPVTRDRDRGIRIYLWAYTSRHILYMQDKDGDENWRVYAVELGSGRTRDLTPFEKVHAQVQEVSPDFPEEVLVGLNDREPQLHDIYRVNIATGEKSLVQRNEGFAGFVTDEDFNVRFAMRLTPDGGSQVLQPTEDGGWELFMKVEADDLLTTEIKGFDKTGRVLYMSDSRGRDTAAMATIDLDTGQQTTVAEDNRSDVSDVMVHPTEKDIQAVAFTYERKRWEVRDKAVAADLERLRAVADGDIEVVSRTLDDRVWVVAYLMDDGPVRYYRYDREMRRADFLFSNRETLEGLPLAKMHPTIIKSRDGLEMVCYYTLPLWSNPDVAAVPTEPLPMVLDVHGGPWARDDGDTTPCTRCWQTRATPF
jgi:dipeptidyl aminopeptidase/acylaminoacyl peptidase